MYGFYILKGEQALEQEFRRQKLRHDTLPKTLSIHQSVDRLKHCNNEERLRGLALVQQLLASTQAQLKGEGIKYLVVYGRIPHFWRHTLDHMPKMALLKSLFSSKTKQEMIQKALIKGH